jgi:hypothetical protein
MPAVKQTRIARETMDVFVPLAQRLGLWNIKCDLEELCFPVNFHTFSCLDFLTLQISEVHICVYCRFHSRSAVCRLLHVVYVQ